MEKKKVGLPKILFVLFVTALILLGLLVCLLAFYPLWRLFVWIVNLVGVKGIRGTDRKLETPIVFYEHPMTKRIVVFIATIHLAEPEYFSALQRRIESLSGYKILFEGTVKLSPEEEQALTEKERDVARNFAYVFNLMDKLGEIMSFQHQKQGLSYAPWWVNTDMRSYDLIRLFAQQDIRLVRQGKELGDSFNSESTQLLMRWLINKLLSRFIPVTIAAGVLTLFSRKKRLAMKIILYARNEEAVRGINKYLKESNVATVWGAAHFKGIEKQLKRTGFREVSREWFTAYRVRDYSLLDCLKKMITIAKTTASSATALNKD